MSATPSEISAIPQRSILFVERDQRAVRIRARVTPGISEEHQR